MSSKFGISYLHKFSHLQRGKGKVSNEVNQKHCNLSILWFSWKTTLQEPSFSSYNLEIPKRCMGFEHPGKSLCLSPKLDPLSPEFHISISFFKSRYNWHIKSCRYLMSRAWCVWGWVHTCETITTIRAMNIIITFRSCLLSCYGYCYCPCCYYYHYDYYLW